MKHAVTIGWLYPDLMSTYGDRGNILCLKRRLEWRGIEAEVLQIGFETTEKELATSDMVIGGGAQDRQQELALDDLKKKKAGLTRLFEAGTPGLFVCGSPQLLGHFYMTGDGQTLEGLGIFDYETRHFGHDKPRCIGNTAAQIDSTFHPPAGGSNSKFFPTIVGFENHGGRTYLGPGAKPFAKVLVGNGNNGEDGYEGAVYKNVIACYYHGPFLPKNPHIADWLIAKALEKKYGHAVDLAPLDDALEWKAHTFMLQRMGIEDGKTD